MGFFDNVQSKFEQGTAAVGRTGKTLKLKNQLSDINRQRTDLAAQLGASL